MIYPLFDLKIMLLHRVNILIDYFLKDQFTHLFFVDYDASIIIEDKNILYYNEERIWNLSSNIKIS